MVSTVAAVISPKLLSYLPLMILGAALLGGLIVAYRLHQETHEDDDPVTTDELLAEFEEAHASGELDEAEYRRVTELLRNPLGPKRAAAARPLTTTPAPQS